MSLPNNQVGLKFENDRETEIQKFFSQNKGSVSYNTLVTVGSYVFQMFCTSLKFPWLECIFKFFIKFFRTI